jgi:hypothetical protein
MKLIQFETKYGLRVIGGEFGDQIRSLSSLDDLIAPLEQVSVDLILRAEKEHEIALDEHCKSWNLK